MRNPGIGTGGRTPGERATAAKVLADPIPSEITYGDAMIPIRTVVQKLIADGRWSAKFSKTGDLLVIDGMFGILFDIGALAVIDCSSEGHHEIGIADGVVEVYLGRRIGFPRPSFPTQPEDIRMFSQLCERGWLPIYSDGMVGLMADMSCAFMIADIAGMHADECGRPEAISVQRRFGCFRKADVVMVLQPEVTSFATPLN